MGEHQADEGGALGRAENQGRGTLSAWKPYGAQHPSARLHLCSKVRAVSPAGIFRASLGGREAGGPRVLLSSPDSAAGVSVTLSFAYGSDV